jgi:transcription elongation factor
MALLTDLLSTNTTDIAANATAAASATTAANNAGNMTIHTANGSSVAVGESFLLTSTSTMPSTWSWNGSSFVISQNGGHWIGIFNPGWVSTSFKHGAIYHGNNTSDVVSVTRAFFNGSTLSVNPNLDSYLPALLTRIA